MDDLADLVEATRQIAAQTRQRLSGQTPDGSTRRVSLHDPDARPIAKGRLGKPVEFGHKAQLVEGDDGVVVDHTVERGNPADAPQLSPAVDRVTQRAGRPPRTVTADRGYGEQSVDDDLHDLGVKNVVIPRKGKPSAARRAEEHRPAFRRTLKWRTGCEGRISTLKRGPTRLDPHLALSGTPARVWEPKRLRLRLLRVAARIIRSGRRRRLRLPRGWPWAHLITTGWQHLHVLT